MTTPTAPAMGTCVCTAVRFQIEGPYRGFQYCHCSRCRKRSGSGFIANLFVPPGQFAWVDGEAIVKRFELPEAKYWCSAFCERCGSAAPWLNKPGTAFVVPAGALDDDPLIRPERRVYFASRPSWYLEPSELETHPTLPNS